MGCFWAGTCDSRGCLTPIERNRNQIAFTNLSFAIGIGILVVAPLVVTTLGARLLDRLRGHVMMRVSRRP